MSVLFNVFTGTFDFVGSASGGGGGGAVDSVNGQIGTVVLTTDDINEGSTHLYFTSSRARESVTGNAPIHYDETTGTFSITQSSATGDGYLSSTDWNTFNNKAPLDSPVFTGVPQSPTPSLADSSTKIATTAFVQSQGFLTSTGAIPTGEQDNAVGVTSATTSFVTALTTTVTLTQTAPILAVVNATLTTTTAASVAGTRITINAVASRTALISLTALATNYLASSHFISASLAPGTYTVNFDIQRSSGTGTVNYASGTLIAEGLQGTNSNGITQLTGNVTAGPGSGSQAATIASNVITNAMVNSAAAIAYSKLASLSTGQILVGNAGVPTATTLGGDATIGATGTLTVANSAITNAKIANCDASKITTGTLGVARGGTGVANITSRNVPFGNGTGAIGTDPNFTFDASGRLQVGGSSGAAKINAVVTSGSQTALQAYNQSAGNAFQAVNVSAYTAALISRQNNSTTGASIGLEFGRGTALVPTGALNGDQIGVIAATPDAPTGVAFGYCGAISFVASEDASTTNTGGEIVLSTTANGGNLIPTERVRIKNSGESVFQQAIALARFTTGQKNALTPAGGWVVYDTDLNQLSYYNGTMWVNL